MTAVAVTNLDFSYDGRSPVLSGVDLTVARGELCFLLGGSGCGKSTLLRCIAGFLRPDSGCITFDGQDVARLPPERRRLGMVFQNYALWPHLDVAGNVGFALTQQKVPRADIAQRVAAMLELVGLAGYAGRAIAELSGGQQQRVALARALVARPGLLLLDEPLANLDAGLRREMRGEIRRVCRDTGVTAIAVTHDQEEALAVADRVALMRAGRIVQIGAPRAVYRHPVDAGVAAFLGAANLLPATVLSRDGGGGICRTALGELRVAELGFAVGAATQLCLRPEDLLLAPASGSVNTISVELIGEAYGGGTSRWTLRSGGMALEATELTAPVRALGPVLVAIAPERIVALPADIAP